MIVNFNPFVFVTETYDPEHSENSLNRANSRIMAMCQTADPNGDCFLSFLSKVVIDTIVPPKCDGYSSFYHFPSSDASRICHPLFNMFTCTLLVSGTVHTT
jgi:hypothetical protein